LIEKDNVSNYFIKKIETDDEYDRVEYLWKSRNSLMKNPLPSHSIDNIRDGIIIAAFLENEIVGTMRYFIWKNIPCYQIGGLCVKPGLIKTFSNLNNPINFIMDYVLEGIEKQHLYTWYYVRPIKKVYAQVQSTNYNLFAKHDFLNQTLLGKRYIRFIEEVVLPGNKSKYESFNKSLIGNQTWNNPVMIVKCSLDDKYRSNKMFF
jgi:hypothetical protein